MKIELKKIQHNKRMSQETEAFSADLYIDGKNAGVAYNSGHGGPADYEAHNAQGIKLITEAEAYCLKLPPMEIQEYEGDFTLTMNLEVFIDNLLTDHLQQQELQRFNKKMEKDMLTGIVIGTPDECYSVLPSNRPLKVILESQDGPATMGRLLEQYVLPKLKDGKILLNTNIPEDLLKAANLKADQYVKPAETLNRKAKANYKNKSRH